MIFLAKQTCAFFIGIKYVK